MKQQLSSDLSKEKVIRLMNVDHRVGELMDRIRKTVYDYSILTGLNSATVIGVLKLVTHEILHETMED